MEPACLVRHQPGRAATKSSPPASACGSSLASLQPEEKDTQRAQAAERQEVKGDEPFCVNAEMSVASERMTVKRTPAASRIRRVRSM